jgi:hypothetical protein
MVELNKKLLDRFLNKFKKQKKEGEVDKSKQDLDVSSQKTIEENSSKDTLKMNKLTKKILKKIQIQVKINQTKILRNTILHLLIKKSK